MWSLASKVQFCNLIICLYFLTKKRILHNMMIKGEMAYVASADICIKAQPGL